MFASNDKAYYQDRESNERRLAAEATDPAVRAIHEEMAAKYHGMAIAAEFNEGPQRASHRLAAG